MRAIIKQDLHESLKKQLKDLDKKLIIYSRTRTFKTYIFGDETMRDKVKITNVEVTDNFNMFNYKYIKKAFISEENWLGIDIFG